MTISINNSVQSTWIFIAIFLVILLFSLKRRSFSGLSNDMSTELKGFGILSIIFAHIGYILVSDNRFLFPISILAGVGVSLFLFLSGFGLTKSLLKKDESVLQFYKRKLSRLFIPLWIIIIFFLILDYIVLHIIYAQQFILKAFLGIFTNANAFTDLNSPLWYFTLILIYYILFPIFFSKKYPWISAIVLYILTYGIFYLNFDFFKNVSQLYKVHLIAFPLGIFVAGSSVIKNVSVQNIEIKIMNKYKRFEKIIYPILMTVLLFVIGYTALYSGVGKGIRLEQSITIITLCAIILLFMFKKYEFKIFSIFGIYSYEIYLLHWPIMYRYDIFYRYFPAWLATILYLGLFILLAKILKTFSEKILFIGNPRQNSKI